MTAGRVGAGRAPGVFKGQLTPEKGWKKWEEPSFMLSVNKFNGFVAECRL